MIIEKYLNLILEAHFNERKEMKAFFVTEAEMAKENHVKTTTFFNKCFDAVLKIEADLQNQLSRDKFENKKKLQEAQNEKYVITTQKGTKVASKSSCKKIAKELTTIIQEMKISNYSFDTDRFSEGKYKEYITYFDIELIKQQICEAEKEFNSNILKTSTGKLKFDFTKENLRPMILSLAKMEGIEKPSIFLDVLLSEVKEFNDFEFECDFFIKIQSLCKENASEFVSERGKKDITNWFNKASFYSDVFEKTWTIIPVAKKHSEVEIKSIIFNDSSTIGRIHQLLISHFPNQESELLEVLKGKKIENVLFFQSNQNKLVEVFRRMKYNNLITSNDTEICKWICSSFHFKYKRGGHEEIRPFNYSSVWDTLTKGKNEPPKSARICYKDIEWLPYKSHSTLKHDKQKENL